MTFHLKIFTALLFGSGVYRLYQHFAMTGKITSAGEVLNSTVLVSVFFIAVAVGLFMRRSWGRLAAMGLCVVGVLGPITGAIYVAINYRQFVMGFALLIMFFQKLPTFLNNIFGYILVGLIVVAISVLLFILTFMQLKSAEALEYYDDRPWFNLDLSFREFDLRPFAFSLLFVLAGYWDQVTPKSWTSKLQTKQFVQASKAVKAELEKDPVYVKQQEQARKAREKAQLDSQNTHLVQFTLDGTKIWIVARDRNVHLVDLRQYKSQVFEFGRFHQGRVNDLAADGSVFYHPDRKVFVRTADRAETPWTGGKILGFANPPEKVLVFQSATKTLELVDLRTKEKSWSIDWSEDNQQQPLLNGIFWSADRKLALLAPKHGFFLLNLQSGKAERVDFQFRYPEFQATSARSGQLLVSGPASFKPQPYKTYLIDSRTGKWTEVATEEAITGFDPDEKILISRVRGQLRFLRMDAPTQVLKQQAVAHDGPFQKLNGKPWILSLQHSSPQVSFTNTETYSEKKVGHSFSAETPLESAVSRAGATESGDLVAIAVRNKLQVFWASELSQANPRSWGLDLDIKSGQN